MLRRTGSTRWMVALIAALMIPTVVALAADGPTVVGTKRIERRGGTVVTVVPAEVELDVPVPDPIKGTPLPLPPETPVPDATETPVPEPTETPVPEPTETPVPEPTETPVPDATESPLEPTACEGIDVAPGAGLGAEVAKAPEGATFCLGAGSYTTSSPIRPKSGHKFVGAGPAATSVTTGSAQAVFDAKGTTGVLWQGLAISGAKGSEACKPMCGRGISGGRSGIVRDVRIHDNATSGIGGTEGGYLIADSELDHNGSPPLVGCCAAGIKSANAYTILNSNVHDNVGVGIWCDVGCDGGTFQALGNTVVGNLRGGIRYEIAGGPAVIKGNVVRNNNLSNAGGHGGIEVNASRNVTIEGNSLGENRRADIIANGSRSLGLGNVAIVGNTLAGDELAGCGGGVLCANNN